MAKDARFEWQSRPAEETEKRKEKRRAGSLNLTMNSHPAGSNHQHRLVQGMRGGAKLRHLMRCHLMGSPHAHERTRFPLSIQTAASPRANTSSPGCAQKHARARARRHWRTPVCSQSDHTAHSHATRAHARAQYNPYIIRKHADVSPSSS